MSATQNAIDAARIAAAAADKLKANDIIAYDVSQALGITDIMLIASASNERQVLAIAEDIERAMYVDAHRKNPQTREGVEEGQWILLDYGDVIVHIMHDEARDFYKLERLWGDLDQIDLQLPQAPADDAADADDMVEETTVVEEA